MADKACPTWSSQKRLEVVHNQFIQGVSFPTVQLKLLTEAPDTLDEAMKLAHRLESAEKAQPQLVTAGTASMNHILTVQDNSLCVVSNPPSQVDKLSEQVVQLAEKVTQLLNTRRGREQQKMRTTCWIVGDGTWVEELSP